MSPDKGLFIFRPDSESTEVWIDGVKVARRGDSEAWVSLKEEWEVKEHQSGLDIWHRGKLYVSTPREAH